MTGYDDGADLARCWIVGGAIGATDKKLVKGFVVGWRIRSKNKCRRRSFVEEIATGPCRESE